MAFVQALGNCALVVRTLSILCLPLCDPCMVPGVPLGWLGESRLILKSLRARCLVKRDLGYQWEAGMRFKLHRVGKCGITKPSMNLIP